MAMRSRGGAELRLVAGAPEPEGREEGAPAGSEGELAMEAALGSAATGEASCFTTPLLAFGTCAALIDEGDEGDEAGLEGAGRFARPFPFLCVFFAMGFSGVARRSSAPRVGGVNDDSVTFAALVRRVKSLASRRPGRAASAWT